MKLRRILEWLVFIGKLVLAIPLIILILFLAILCDLEDRLRGG